MDIITLDFETYFDNDYTLSKLTTEEYVRDPRFEVLGCGVRWPEGNTDWLPPEYVEEVIKEHADCAFLCHHAHFDGLILSHHYGIKPARWLDTLSMARMVVGNHLPKGLGALAEHYRLAEKSVPYDLFKGKHWDELTPEVQTAVRDGCLHDVSLTYDIFLQLAKEFPKAEYPLVDLTVRMFTEPWLEGDLDLFAKLWWDETNRKGDLLQALGVTAKQLQSPEQFADLLRARGIEPPTKPGKAGPIYAFAKTDQFMRDLVDGEDEVAANLARARLGIRSTIVQTRTERLGNMAMRGPMPVYLAYAGAHTTRWSGSDKVNWQNFKRGQGLRDGIRAPAGFICAVADASQIEARLLACFAGQTDTVKAFREGRDLYCEMATRLYGETVTKDDLVRRGTGKQLILSAGYGSGSETFKRTAALGIYGPPVEMTSEEAQQAIRLYRTTHSQITALWGTAGALLPILADPQVKPRHWGYGVWIANGRLYGPTGSWIDYSTLRSNGENYEFQKRDGWKKIWGGFLVENCLSATTSVLTHRGWRRIVDVQADDRLWDGEEWVAHQGRVERGRQRTSPLDGVWLTADHGVLTTDGWVRAAQSQGHNRHPVRCPDGAPRRWLDRQEALMADPLRLRQGGDPYDCGVQSDAVLRLLEAGASQSGPNHSWDVEASCLCSVAIDDRPLFAANPSGVEKLWGERDNRLPGMAGFYQVLAGHGAYLPEGSYPGTERQFTGLQPGELCVGHLREAGSQPTHQPLDSDPLGDRDDFGSCAPFGSWGHDPALPDNQRLAPGSLVRTRQEKVYDLLNCGPRQRFVVRGENGPFLVHNCIQFLARIHLGQVMKQLVREGIPKIALCTHDDIFALVRDDDDAEKWLGHMIGLLSKSPSWMPDVPLSAEGGLGRTYGEAK